MDEIVLNYHITEKCNYSCNYCFAKYGLENSFKHELHHDIRLVGRLLSELYNFFKSKYKSSVIRLNLAGGEPLITPSIEKVIDIAINIGYRVSIITNTSPLTNKFIDRNARKLSIVGLSIDSFNRDVNLEIGRSTSADVTVSNSNITQKVNALRLANPNISIKINTVVSQSNFMENMRVELERIKPQKWKIFKELRLGGEPVSNEKFIDFISRNACDVSFPVFIEDNEDMTESYLMIDPLGRFYQNSNKTNSYIYSEKIIDVGIEKALSQITFDLKKFRDRYIASS